MRHLSVDDELYGRCGDVSILLVAPGDVLQLALGGVEALEGLGQLLAQLGGLFPRLPSCYSPAAQHAASRTPLWHTMPGCAPVLLRGQPPLPACTA